MKTNRKRLILASSSLGYGSSGGDSGSVLALSESSFAPTGTEGSDTDPDDDTFDISVTGINSNYSVIVNEDWISVDIDSGTVEEGSPDTITVSYDLDGLSEDTYTDTITVSSDEAGNSPLTISVSLEVTAVPNAVYDVNVRDDTGIYTPTGTSIHTCNENLVVPFWVTGAAKTAMEAAQTVTAGTYVTFVTPSGGGSCGFYDLTNGTYEPHHNNAGNCTNDTDFSTLYDAVRGIVWVYVNNSNPSSGVFINFGQRPTTGGTGFGTVGCKLERNAYYGSIGNRPATYVDDGEGNASCVDLGAGDCMKKYCYIKFEFIKGTSLRVGAGTVANVGAYPDATWPIGGTLVDMSPTNLAKIVPTTPIVRGQSGTGTDSVVLLSGFFAEYRAIGGDWEVMT